MNCSNYYISTPDNINIETVMVRPNHIYTNGPKKIFNNTYTFQSTGPKYDVSISSCMVHPIQSNLNNNFSKF
jgi:hypothetical protein